MDKLELDKLKFYVLCFVWKKYKYKSTKAQLKHNKTTKGSMMV